ncbi:MAG: symmetrical bis(5'-nucleosyl)-tetraphosphatase [Gammaproteobacteria bacterium]
MAVYAIGDIQGCYDELYQLLGKLNFNADKDQLWLTGDLVNRGPKSLETLRYVHAMRDNIVVVLGNHDLHLLATAYHHKKPGKKDTLDDILNASDNTELFDWLRHQPLMHRDDILGFTLVHAGIHPHWSVDTALKLAGEVEQVLRSDEHTRFYQHMYGDKPLLWDDTLSGWSRVRFITNILTRMRYCDASGHAPMNAKGPPGSQPQGLFPWFEMERASSTERVIFGHWSTLPVNADYEKYNVYPLDSGCLWGGALTALRIDQAPFSRTLFNCPQSQKP